MEIVMKDYNLEYFKDKDIYTWDEIILKIEEMESSIHYLTEKIEEYEEVKEQDEYQIFEDYRLEQEYRENN